MAPRWNEGVLIAFGLTMGLILGLVFFSPSPSLATPTPPTVHTAQGPAPRSDNSAKLENKTFSQQTFSEPVALFTAVLAVFTVVLALASIWQGRLTSRSITLARQEFFATHRPKIVVHSVQHADGATEKDDEFNVCAMMTYFNVGTTPAKSVSIHALIIPVQIDVSLQENIAIPLIQEVPEIVAGNPVRCVVRSNVLRSNAESRGRREVAPDGRVTLLEHPIEVYCIGTFTYVDASNVVRQTGFCWKWRRDRTWQRIEENSYSYAY